MKQELILVPKVQRVLTTFGENLKLARLRRNLSMEQISERAGISRSTLWQVEKGKPTVSMGTYLQVLVVLGLERDLLKLGADDELGRKLQDVGLMARERAPKK